MWNELHELVGNTNSVIWEASSGRNFKQERHFEDNPPAQEEDSENLAKLRELWDHKFKPTFDRIAAKILEQKCPSSTGF